MRYESGGRFRRLDAVGWGTLSRRAMVYQCASKSSAEDVCSKLERLGIASEVWAARRSFDNPCPFHVVAEAPYVMREAAPSIEEEEEPAPRKRPLEEEEEEEEPPKQQQKRKRATHERGTWAGHPIDWDEIDRRVPAKVWRGKWRAEPLGPTSLATWARDLWIMDMGYGQDVMRWLKFLMENTRWAVVPVEHRPRKGACERKAAADPEGRFHLLVRFADAEDAVACKTRRWERPGGDDAFHVAVIECGADLARYRQIVDHFLALEYESVSTLDARAAMAQRGDWSFL
jgi:hypothetical protein